MIKVSKEMMLAFKEAAREVNALSEKIDDEDITYLFTSMYEAADMDIKPEVLKKQLESYLELADKNTKRKDQLISDLMDCIMLRNYSDNRTIDERVSDFRDICYDNDWCIRCSCYHADGFCDYEEY